MNSAFLLDLSANGRVVLPIGLILQWFRVNTSQGEGPVRLNFPHPFPNGCVIAVGNIYNATNSNLMDFSLQMNGWDANGVNAYYQASAPGPNTLTNPSGAFVIAIGY